MTDYSKWAVVVCAALVVAGCSSSSDKSGIWVLNGGAQPTASAIARPQPQTICVLSAEEIRSTLIGKNWQYTRPDSSGFITYNADGSLTYQDDTKGEGRGTWSAVQG